MKVFEALEFVRLREPRSSIYVLETTIDQDLDASRERLAQAADAFWAVDLPRPPADKVDRVTLWQ
jgi:hypothetical protein